MCAMIISYTHNDGTEGTTAEDFGDHILRLSLHTQFYEEAWAGNLDLLANLLAEQHTQRDMVWQVSVQIRAGLN